MLLCCNIYIFSLPMKTKWLSPGTEISLGQSVSDYSIQHDKAKESALLRNRICLSEHDEDQQRKPFPSLWDAII